MAGCLTRRLGGSGSYPSAPDANTVFLTRFAAATPTEEVSGVSGSFAGGASCDTANKQLVLDGTGDWATWPSPSSNAAMTGRYSVTTNWTMEVHTNLAAAQVGGIMSRGATGGSRYALYCSGSGNVAFYADAFSTGVPVVDSSAANLDGNEHHIAVVRDGGTYRMYFDGVQVDSQAWASAPANTSLIGLFIGTDEASTTTRDVAGRIARFKLSDVCRYPSGTTFTPPTRFDA